MRVGPTLPSSQLGLREAAPHTLCPTQVSGRAGDPVKRLLEEGALCLELSGRVMLGQRPRRIPVAVMNLARVCG